MQASTADVLMAAGTNMVVATRRKLDEAQFFYQLLVNECPHPMKAFGHDQRAFRYYFSAFIQAARSVTWTLGNEEPEKWKAWEPAWKANRRADEQKLLDLTNKLRLDEAKRGGANALIVWEEVALNELLALPDVEPWKRHPAFGGHVFAPPRTPSPITRRQAFYFEDEDGKEEVTALCRRYLDFLEKMLNDFRADHQPE
jgi:hypothetical protein